MEIYYYLAFFLVLFVAVYLVVHGVDRSAKPYDVGTIKVAGSVLDTKTFRGALFRLLNVDINEVEEGTYFVTYQGGNFSFTFSENNSFLNITYPGFAELKYEELEKGLEVINGLNLQHYWTGFLCYSSDNEKPITASCSFLLTLNGTPEENAQALSKILVEPFYIAREFHNKMDRGENNASGERSPLITDIMHKLQYDSLRMQIAECKSVEPRGTTVALIMDLVKDVDFGCIVGLRIVRNDNVETINEPGTILAFDFDDFVKEHYKECDRFTFLLDFEKESLVVDVQKNACGTKKHLVYNLSVMRCGGNLNEKYCPYCFTTMFEVHLTTVEEDGWEAKYMLDEMTEDATFCNYASSLDEHMRFSLYWGMKFYNNGAYLQALEQLKKVYYNIQDPQDEKTIHAYCLVSEMIGSIYLKIGMPDTAINYILSLAMGIGIERVYPLVADCFSSTNDIAALDGLAKMRYSIIESLEKREESVYDPENTIRAYLLLNHKIVELLIKRGKNDEAKDFLENMIRNGEDVEWAKVTLENL